MTIQIHPEAAKRFDELANQLLAKVVPEPQLVPIGGEFRPDIYPVFQIPEQDIIGELQVTKSFFDGTGEEVGRLFEHENRKLGLIGESFKSFVQLAVRLHDTEAIRETTSLEFIRDTAFAWLEGKYKNERPESLTEYVLKIAEDEIKDFDIWIPLHRTYLESPLAMGPVVFRTVTRAMLDEAYARIPQPDPETAAAVRLALARDRSAVQGCAAAAIKVRAERRRAVEVAREQAGTTAALLRFLSPANWTPKTEILLHTTRKRKCTSSGRTVSARQLHHDRQSRRPRFRRRTLRVFLLAMFFPPVAQVVNNSGYSTCFGREVKGKHCEAIYCEIMRRRR